MATEGDEPEAEPTGPSAVFDTVLRQTARALHVEEIQEIIDGFAEGMRRAQESGFDGVQLHAAHGWLLSSFLSPHTNKREDDYGGRHENRIRIIKEIYEKGRKKVGENYPIMIKMDTTDLPQIWFSGGPDKAKCISCNACLPVGKQAISCKH